MNVEEKDGVKWISIVNGDDPNSVIETAKNNGATDTENGIQVFRVKPQFGVMDESPILVDEQKLRQLLDTSKGFQQ